MDNLEAGWGRYAEGMQAGWDFCVSEDDMRAFEKISGDHNPIHVDPVFARTKGFDAPIVYGLLLSAQLSRLVGQELPDRHAILTGISVSFMKPAFAGEALRFDAELVNKSDATRILEFKCRITRAGKTLCRGTAEAVWRGQ